MLRIHQCSIVLNVTLMLHKFYWRWKKKLIIAKIKFFLLNVNFQIEYLDWNEMKYFALDETKKKYQLWFIKSSYTIILIFLMLVIHHNTKRQNVHHFDEL